MVSMSQVKVHLNLDVRDLSKSVTFYRTLLDAEPTKNYDDYALFVTENPGLELALDRDPNPRIGKEHFGLVFDSNEAVYAANGRLQAAGFETEVWDSQHCCYAIQTKIWVLDPDGRRWEVYVVHQETAERGSPSRTVPSKSAV